VNKFLENPLASARSIAKTNSKAVLNWKKETLTIEKKPKTRQKPGPREDSENHPVHKSDPLDKKPNSNKLTFATVKAEHSAFYFTNMHALSRFYVGFAGNY
jgi:hypothetical protein